MALIYVKTKPGRRAYYEGRIIPQDKFIPVTDDPYIRRLVNHWEDLIVEENPGRSADKATASRKKSEGDKAPPGRPTEPSNNPAPGTGAPRPTN